MTISICKSVKRISQPATDELVLDLVRTWIELLANQDYQAAFELTGHDSYYSWSPELIRRVVEGYGLPEESASYKYAVTKTSETHGGPEPRWEVEWFSVPNKDGKAGDVSADLPLDGTWSDLTATFEIYLENEQYVLVLNDIHVL